MAKTSRPETSVERIEREWEALKRVFGRNRLIGVGIVLVALVYGAFRLQDLWKVSSKPDQSPNTSTSQPLVSMSCRPETFPIEVKQGARIYGVQLHPKWGNVIQAPTPQTGQPGTKSVWPDLRKNNIGYLCEIANAHSESLSGLFVPLQVKFFSPSATIRNRLIDVPIPVTIDPQKNFSFYVADDTGWAPEVTTPERVRGRVGSVAESREIPVRYPSFDGKPLHLGGFGIQVP